MESAIDAAFERFVWVVLHYCTSAATEAVVLSLMIAMAAYLLWFIFSLLVRKLVPNEPSNRACAWLSESLSSVSISNYVAGYDPHRVCCCSIGSLLLT